MTILIVNATAMVDIVHEEGVAGSRRFISKQLLGIGLKRKWKVKLVGSLSLASAMRL